MAEEKKQDPTQVYNVQQMTTYTYNTTGDYINRNLSKNNTINHYNTKSLSIHKIATIDLTDSPLSNSNDKKLKRSKKGKKREKNDENNNDNNDNNNDNNNNNSNEIDIENVDPNRINARVSSVDDLDEIEVDNIMVESEIEENLNGADIGLPPPLEQVYEYGNNGDNNNNNSNNNIIADPYANNANYGYSGQYYNQQYNQHYNQRDNQYYHENGENYQKYENSGAMVDNNGEFEEIEYDYYDEVSMEGIDFHDYGNENKKYDQNNGSNW